MVEELAAIHDQMPCCGIVNQEKTKRYQSVTPIWARTEEMLIVVAEAVQLTRRVGKPIHHRLLPDTRHPRAYNRRRTSARDAWLRVAAYAIERAEEIDREGASRLAELRNFWAKEDGKNPPVVVTEFCLPKEGMGDYEKRTGVTLESVTEWAEVVKQSNAEIRRGLGS